MRMGFLVATEGVKTTTKIGAQTRIKYAPS